MARVRLRGACRRRSALAKTRIHSAPCQVDPDRVQKMKKTGPYKMKKPVLPIGRLFAKVVNSAYFLRTKSMYIPSHFAENRPDQLQRIIRAHPLGALVTQGTAGLDADHIPFEFDPDPGPHGLLSAHVARANPLWQRCPSGSEVMVIFQSAQAYISPNW